MPAIEIRGARVHNLRNVDVDIPLNRLTVITGVSGSGKSSLAFDTLAVEGQRRYVESFSATARQHLDRLEKPDADRIDHLPPAVGLRQNSITRSPRATVATVTEIDDLLRVLLSRIGTVHCPDCHLAVQSHTAESVAAWISTQPDGQRFQLAFPFEAPNTDPAEADINDLQESGFTRAVRITTRAGEDAQGQTLDVSSLNDNPDESLTDIESYVIVDRLVTGKVAPQRLIESLESCILNGDGCCIVLMQTEADDAENVAIDGRHHQLSRFSARLDCDKCRRVFLPPEPRLLSYRSPLGACRDCQGTGMLTDQTTCSTCAGTRLRSEARAVGLVIGSSSDTARDDFYGIAQVSAFTVDDARGWLQQLPSHLTPEQIPVTSELIPELVARLTYLQSVGLGYLQLNRALSSLSRGEAQRAAMTGILGSRLVNTLFVLDEPSAGLHPRDVGQIVELVQHLRDSSNTVVVVEHEPDFAAAADYRLDIGPGAGRDGGQVVFAGTSSEWSALEHINPAPPSPPTGGRTDGLLPALKLVACRHHTLDGVSVEIPLGCLCVVAGVSGAGKSSLVEGVLYPALCQRLDVPCEINDRGECGELTGAEHLSHVELVSDAPLKGGRRSTPVTWLKAFGEIRGLFSDTGEAHNRNLAAGDFSFITDRGGRCPKCKGTGTVEIDMQFLADVVMTCPDCHGSRYQRHILEVTWRGRSIADVLAMTAAEAFAFFRGQPKIQKKLRTLKDVGLDYLTLGQPLATLSGGEAQRLKLASSLAATGRSGSLLILNEPTTGLHPLDVERLLECFRGLLAVGHSLIVIEHHLNVIRAADHVIDMGPEAGPEGGHVVVSGSVIDVMACSKSITGQFLRDGLS